MTDDDQGTPEMIEVAKVVQEAAPVVGKRG